MRIRIAGLASIVAVALLVAVIAPGIAGGSAVGDRSAAADTTGRVSVIVRTVPGQADDVKSFVSRTGGQVTDSIAMIGALVCDVPSDSVVALKAQPGVAAVTLDATCSRAEEYTWTPADDAAGTIAGTTEANAGTTGTATMDGIATTTELVAPAPSDPVAVTPTNVFLDTTRARSVWKLTRHYESINGRGVTIAVIDSGVTDGADFRSSDYYTGSTCIRKSISFVADEPSTTDGNGHGTHVAGLIGGDGSASSAGYSGVAPGAKLINLKVSGADAQATEADVLNALQWVYDNHDTYGIRVVNLSLNSDVAQSYKQSPIDAACEILWFNGIVVVASAGNSGPDGVTLDSAPANDPFVITVGATDESYTASLTDDQVAPFSAYGVTDDGFAKPDVYAPGRNIYGTLSQNSLWASLYPERLDASGKYFRMSGTSCSAPIVAGTVALMLQEEPSLTPDQVKSRLVKASASLSDPTGAKKPYLDAYRAVTSTDLSSANTGTAASTLLTTGEESILTSSVMWNSVMWNSVMWNSVMWNSVMWNSVMWNSVMWNSGETLSCQSVMWH